jgi:hypothetical protein
LRFRGGLVFQAQRLCVSLNSGLESDKEEEKKVAGAEQMPYALRERKNDRNSE